MVTTIRKVSHTEWSGHLSVTENMLINKYSYLNGELGPKLQKNVNKNQ